MIFCTSICSNYLDKAMVLARSLKLVDDNYKFVLFLVEEQAPYEAKDYPYFDKVVLAKDLDFDNFHSHIFKHTIVEAATSIKGEIFTYLLARYKDNDKFVYLDPDIKVYSKLMELEDLLDDNQIVLTPHLCEHETSLDNVIHNELCSLRYGVYNLGFLAIRRGQESVKFINWWSERLRMFCYDDIPNGVFTDQKWVDLAPALFNVYILKHPGYNFAPWNYSKRKIEEIENQYYVNRHVLRFIHFSGYDSGANKIVTNKYFPDTDHLIYKILDEYSSEMENICHNKELSKIKWSYSTFSNGHEISKEHRKLYRSSTILQQINKNPFIAGNLNPFSEVEEKKYLTYRDIINEFNITEDKIKIKNFDLNLNSMLKNIPKDGKYLIWGYDIHGKITKRLMSEVAPKLKCLGYIDKYKKSTSEEEPIYSIEDIEKMPFDYILICTNGGKQEATYFLKQLGYDLGRGYIYGYGIQ